MGVKSLNTLIINHAKNSEKKIHLSKFNGYKLAIDTNVYLYKYLYGKSNHINGIFFMVNKMKKFGITPIFIFDGKPPKEKNQKIIQRKSIRNKLQTRLLNLKSKLNLEDDNNKKNEILEEINNIEKKIMYVNKVVVQKTQALFDNLGVAYINADCEAEHYCSKLCRLGIVEGVISEDTDTIASGSKLVLRDFSNRDDNITCFDINEILYGLNLNYNSFVDLCILLGNDYNNRPRGYSIDTILKFVQEFGSIEKILNANMIKYIKFDYNKIRKIIKLDDINIDLVEINNQFNKIGNLDKSINFLDEHSTIDRQTYQHRLKLMFKKNKKKRSSNFLKDNPYLKNLKMGYNNFKQIDSSYNIMY
jgi:flap endonuclease-1